MTLDMLQILIDSAVRALEGVSEVDHWMGLLFMAFVLGVGSGWALSLIIKDWSFKKIHALF